MFERNFAEVQAIRRYFKTSGYDKACARTKPLGGGTYNEVYTTVIPVTQSRNTELVVRLSFYNNQAIHSMNLAIENYKKKHDSADASQTSRNDFNKLRLHCKKIRNKDPVQIKNSIGLLSNFFIERNVSPHFVYMYYESDCKRMLDKMHSSKDPERKYLCQNNMGKIYNNVAFLEKFDTDLSKLIIEGSISERELKAAIFQVLYSLAALQHYIPNFRHNDLSCQNVLVKMNPRTGSGCYSYKAYDRTFYLPQNDCRVFAAVYDFDLSYANSRVLNVSSKNPDIDLRNNIIHTNHFAKHHQQDVRNINPAFNPSFDVHYFLWTLAWYVQRSSLPVVNGKPEEPASKLFPMSQKYPNIQKWLEFMGILQRYPKDDRYTENMGNRPRYIGFVVDAMIPINVINAPLFEEFQTKRGSVIRSFEIKSLPIQTSIEVSEMLNWKRPVETQSVTSQEPPMLYSGKPKDSTGRKLQVFEFKRVPHAYFPQHMLPTFMEQNIYPHLIPLLLDFGGSIAVSQLDAALIKRACENPSSSSKILDILAQKLSMQYRNKGDLCKAIETTLGDKLDEKFEDFKKNKGKTNGSLFFEKDELMAIAKEQGIKDKELFKVSKGGNLIAKRKQDVCNMLRQRLLTSSKK